MQGGAGRLSHLVSLPSKILHRKSLYSFLVSAVRDWASRWLAARGCGLSQFWTPEVGIQGAAGLVPPGALQKRPAPASLPACDAAYEPRDTHHCGVCFRLQGAPPPSLCVPQIFLLLLGHLTLDLGLTPNPA